MDEGLEAAEERGWREVAAIDAAYARGELGGEGWHAAMVALVVPAYLAAETPEGGSGSSGDAAGLGARAPSSSTRSSPARSSSTSGAPTGT